MVSLRFRLHCNIRFVFRSQIRCAALKSLSSQTQVVSLNHVIFLRSFLFSSMFPLLLSVTSNLFNIVYYPIIILHSAIKLVQGKFHFSFKKSLKLLNIYIKPNSVGQSLILLSVQTMVQILYSNKPNTSTYKRLNPKLTIFNYD